jgi:dUTP pyrophosphatase
MELLPGDFKLVSTGLKWEPPTNEHELQVRPRSGMAAKHGITVLNTPGTVDASYRGIIKVILINHSKVPYQIRCGDRIAQAVFAKVDKTISLKQTDAVNETKRGTGGMGSTGK